MKTALTATLVIGLAASVVAQDWKLLRDGEPGMARIIEADNGKAVGGFVPDDKRVARRVYRHNKSQPGWADFDYWMGLVYERAGGYGLTLHPNDQRLREAEEEFFYLECWQSGDRSVRHAIEKAKRVGFGPTTGCIQHGRWLDCYAPDGSWIGAVKQPMDA